MINPAPLPATSREWLEADGLGGFASATAAGIRTRRYHALLLTATTPPTGRFVLVNGFEAWVQTPAGTFPISSQAYSPDVVHPDGSRRIEAFGADPWPHWIFRLEDGTRIEQELFAVKGQPLTCLHWTLLGTPRDVKLFVRPLLSCRDYHSLHKTNPGFSFDPQVRHSKVSWQPYEAVPGISALHNGAYTHQPLWFYNFLYEEERLRGLDCEEDLAAPGVLGFDLAQNQAALLLTTQLHAAATFSVAARPLELFHKFRAAESARRKMFPTRLHAAADAYIVQRVVLTSGGEQSTAEAIPGKTIIAGYPWFADWGRDTFIAVRGLGLATGRLADARDILLEWTGAVSEGMLPNRFPDQGERPEYNSVDASLWFIIAAHEYLEAVEPLRKQRRPSAAEAYLLASLPQDKRKLQAAINAILEGYSQGTRYQIRLDVDGLLAAGEPGVQLTWMDAKVGDWVVTPRIGKPVEIQALWLNALGIARQHDPRWQPLFDKGRRSFEERFWNPQRGCLYDVVDVNHQPGTVDPALRPNQVFALGGLPLALIDGEKARLVLEVVEDQLWTPVGLRSLGRQEPGYAAYYGGGVRQRDGCYHQGTVWPWLLGPFVEAWVRARGNSGPAKAEARQRFLAPLWDHLDEAGLGHISEIADAEPPHTPRGCPFQAWSVGEALRLERLLVAPQKNKTASGRKRELALV